MDSTTSATMPSKGDDKSACCASSLALWEMLLFAIICTADMVSTLIWYQQGVATESNPFLAYWLKRSTTAFCIAKLAGFVPLLIVCFLFRNQYRVFITRALRFAMVAYVFIYAISVATQFIT